MIQLKDFAKENGLTNSDATKLFERAGFAGHVHNSQLSDQEVRKAKRLLKEERKTAPKQPAARRTSSARGPMTIEQMANRLSSRFKVTVTSEQVGLASRADDPENPESRLDVPQDEVVLALVREGVLPDEAIKSVDAKKSSDFRRRPGTSLVLVPAEHRSKNQSDLDNLEWMASVIAADQAIKAEEVAGRPYRPRFEKSASGLGIVYPDPLSHFLEPPQFSPHVPKDSEVNEIYVSLEKFAVFNAKPQQSFQWRSFELLKEFERRFLSLWCVRTHCRQCGNEMGGIFQEIKQILQGRRFLPDTPGVNPKRIYLGNDYHPWCLSLRVELIDLEVKLQDLEGDSSVAVALRSETYVEMIHRVTYKHEDDGATSAVVIAAFRAYLHNVKEMIGNAG